MGFPTVGQTLYGGWTQRGEGYADQDTRFSSYNTKLSGLVCDSVVDDRAALNTLVNGTMQPNGGVLDVIGVPRIASNVAIPSNVRLRFTNGAFLAPDAGVTVTINSSFNRHIEKKFGGGGSVVLAGSRMPYVNAEWWGALGDGATDDTTPINAALVSAPGAGGKVILLNRTYVVAPNNVVTVGSNNYSGALVPAANTLIKGAGKTATVLKAKANYAAQGFMIMVNGLAGVTVRDVGFDGNIANQTLVTVTDNGFSAIKYHNNSTDAEVVGCSFTGFTQDCIFFGYPNGTAVDGLEVHKCVFSDWQRGAVVLVSARNARIHHNKFKNSTRGLGSVATGSNAIWLEPNIGTDPLENVSIDHNSFDTLNGACWLYNAQQTDLFSVVVEGNTFYACDAGVYGVSAWGTRVLGNTFHLCGRNATAAKNKTVFFNNCRWASVIGNWFRDCGGEKGDVELSQASWFATIDENTFVGSRRDCIHVELSATQFGNPTVRNNRGESGGLESVNTYFGITYKCQAGTPGEDGIVTNNQFATSVAAGLAAAYRIENWQGGIFRGNFWTGTGIPVSQVGALRPGYGKVNWTPGNILAGGEATSPNITIAGANFTNASGYRPIPPYSLQGCIGSIEPTGVNTAVFKIKNNTAGAINLNVAADFGALMDSAF